MQQPQQFLKPPSEVTLTSELANLQAQINNQSSVISKLLQVLTPVLKSPQPEDQPISGAIGSPNVSPLAKQIRACYSELEINTQTLNSVLNMVDL
jgi:hypothetical protein